MAGTVLITGANASHFLMACMLMRSLRRFTTQPLHVLDFGLTEAQRRFLADGGHLLDRPRRFAAGLHPFRYKAAMGEYTAPLGADAVAWLDSDMIVVGPLTERLDALTAEMRNTNAQVAVCRDTIGTIFDFLSLGFDVRPMVQLLRTDGVDMGAPYYNTGIVVCVSPAFLRDWTALVERLPDHMLIEQNAFNVLVQRRGRPRELDSAVWNLHGGALGAAVVRGDGTDVRLPGHTPSLLVHPTSPNKADIALRPAIAIGRERIACQMRQCSKPALWNLQLMHLREFLYNSWDDLVRFGIVLEASRPLPPGVSPAVGFLLADALRLQRAGQWVEANAQFAKLDRFNTSADVLACRAVACLQQDRLPEAIELARRAIAANPQHADASLVIGSVLTRQGEPDEALAHLERAAAGEPQVAALQVERSRALEAKGALGEALAAATLATTIAPDQFGAWRQRARILAALGRAPEAAADRERAMALVGVIEG